MAERMILYNKDRPVLQFDLEETYIKVLNNDLLPYTLKDHIKTTGEKDFNGSVHDVTLFKDYLAGRTLNLSRENAKVILNVAALPQSIRTDERIKITLACRGLNMEDNYWIAKENENLHFADVNLRTHKLSEHSYDIAILGRHISATAQELTSDLMTDGMFPKFWRRSDDHVELWKTDSFVGFPNTKAEIKASQILYNAGASTILCRQEIQDDIIFSVSKCMTDNDHSLVKAQEIRDWCTHTGQDLYKWIDQNFKTDFANMCIADFVIANTDRHWENWGILVDSNNELVQMAPLWDLNQSLLADEFNTDISDQIYEPTNKRFKDSVKMLSKYCTLSFKNQELPGKCTERLHLVQRYQNKYRSGQNYGE